MFRPRGEPASCVSGLGGAKEQHDVGNLLWIGHPPRHDELRGPALELLGVVVEDGSGCEGVTVACRPAR